MECAAWIPVLPFVPSLVSAKFKFGADQTDVQLGYFAIVHGPAYIVGGSVYISFVNRPTIANVTFNQPTASPRPLSLETSHFHLNAKTAFDLVKIARNGDQARRGSAMHTPDRYWAR